MHQPSALALKMSSLLRFCSSNSSSSSKTRLSCQYNCLRTVRTNQDTLQAS
jgi:hypothetical protein